MRLTTLLFMLIVAAYLLQGFYRPKCEHIYVSVEQPEIKIEEPKWSYVDDLMPAWTKWPSGKFQGQDLVCVKCFNKVKQILDYGKRECYSGKVTWPANTLTHKTDSCETFNARFFINDSCFIRVDTGWIIFPTSGR